MVEALAWAGVPVIALNRGGARDIVRPTGMAFCSTSQVPALSRAIQSLVRMHWERAELSGRAREFSVERFLSRMSGLLDRLLVTPRRAKPDRNRMSRASLS